MTQTLAINIACFVPKKKRIPKKKLSKQFSQKAQIRSRLHTDYWIHYIILFLSKLSAAFRRLRIRTRITILIKIETEGRVGKRISLFKVSRPCVFRTINVFRTLVFPSPVSYCRISIPFVFLMKTEKTEKKYWKWFHGWWNGSLGHDADRFYCTRPHKLFYKRLTRKPVFLCLLLFFSV